MSIANNEAFAAALAEYHAVQDAWTARAAATECPEDDVAALCNQQLAAERALVSAGGRGLEAARALLDIAVNEYCKAPCRSLEFDALQSNDALEMAFVVAARKALAE